MHAIDKPWGMEEILEKNDKYMFKRLTMYKGHQCSLQKHQYKCETIYVLSGLLKISFGEDGGSLDSDVYHPGDIITLKPGIVHRMEAVEDSVYLEASTPEMDDVIRLQDDYQRV